MPVRMSSTMISYNYKTNLNSALYKLTKMQEQMTKETLLSRPSDNPINTALDMRYKISLYNNNQYTDNTNTAISWMDASHSCMDELTGILHRVRELIIDVAEPTADLAYDAVAAEIDGIINHAIQIANTTMGDRYIFAGQNDRNQEPFYLVPVGSTLPDGTVAAVDTVVYTGDDYKISMVINPGSVVPSQDGVNLTGNEVFNSGKLFEDLIKIRDELRDRPAGQDALISFLSNTAIGMIDDDMDFLLASQSRLSAKVSMYNLGQNMLKSAEVGITENISQVKDVDLGMAAINFTIAQNAYNAALSMGAKLLPLSLADFLR